MLPKVSTLLNLLPAKALSQVKCIYQFFNSYENPPTVLFVVGCQRSGTSLMLDILRRDLNTKTYGEFSKLSSDDPKRIRLNAFASVQHEFQKDRAAIICLKPIVESQNVLELLKYFDGSKALWMYRNYKDVAASNLKKFGTQNGVRDLRFIVENSAQDWRSERVDGDVRRLVVDVFSEEMNPYDAAVLFWYVRNHHFLDLGLETHESVLMCKYEDLVATPEAVVRGIYCELEQPFPGSWITSRVHSRSWKKGHRVLISAEIDSLAQDLMHALDGANKGRKCMVRESDVG